MKRLDRVRMLSVVGVAIGVLASCLGGCSGGPAPAAAGADHRQYAFWPQFPDEPRIQFVASYSSSEDVQPKQTSGLEKLVFGAEEDRQGLIQKPYGVAMRDGKIYVADIRGKALVVLDLRKKQTRLLGVNGFNRLEHPVAVAVAPDGMIYVADNGRGAIFVYDAEERYSTVFGFEKFKPVAVAVHEDRLYAADLAGQKIVIFDRLSGKRVGEFGEVGDEDGQFRVPIGVATDAKGDVYVMDMMRCRMQKFTPDGRFVSGMGTLGDYMSAFVRPKHIAVDSEGIIYAVDSAFQNVQMFDDQYHMLMHFGSLGDYPGAMNLPVGVAVCEDSLDLFRDKVHPGFEPKRVVVVTSQFGGTKVGVYVLGQRREGVSAQELASAAIKVDTGTGAPSADQLKMQTIGGEEPPPEGVPGAGAGAVQPPINDQPRSSGGGAGSPK